MTSMKTYAKISEDTVKHCKKFKGIKMNPTANLAKELHQEYGPLIGGPDLVKVLGFRSNASFKRAQKLGQIDLEMFGIEGRKGSFAYTRNVASWLSNLANKNQVFNREKQQSSSSYEKESG